MTVGQIERESQNRVVALFRDRLGYEFGGNREDRVNSNVEEDLLTAYLARPEIQNEKMSGAKKSLEGLLKSLE